VSKLLTSKPADANDHIMIGCLSYEQFDFFSNIFYYKRPYLPKNPKLLLLQEAIPHQITEPTTTPIAGGLNLPGVCHGERQKQVCCGCNPAYGGT